MTARADAFAPPTATFPLHDVTDVFAKRHNLSNLTALTRRLPRQTVFQIAKLDTIPSAGSRISGAKSQKRWWSQTGSNRRPHACKARALPTELWPPGQGPGGHAQLFVGLPQAPAVTSVTLADAASAATAIRPCGPSVRGATRLRPEGEAFASRKGAGADAPNPMTRMVGLGRLERPTSPLSGVRSNHLSYRPENPSRPTGRSGSRPDAHDR